MDKPIFIFPKYRDFGDVVSDTFKFVRGNLRILTTGFLIYVVPFFIIGAAIMWGLFQMFGGLETQLTFGINASIFLFSISLILSYFMLYAFVFSVVDAYQDHEGQIELSDIWPYMKTYLGKIIAMTFVLILMFSIIGGVVFGLGASLGPVVIALLVLVALPLYIYFSIRFIFILYIYVREKVDFVTSFRRSSFLVQDNWWWTLLIVFVLSIISTIMSYVVNIPVLIYTFTSAFLSTEAGDLNASPSFGVLLSTGFSNLFSLFTQMYFITGIIVHYYSLREKKEGTSLMDKIESIDLGKRSDFENEGEF